MLSASVVIPSSPLEPWHEGSASGYSFAGVPARSSACLIESSRASVHTSPQLLRAGLSEKGYTKAEMIRKLEGVLREIEGRSSGPTRDPDLYFFTFFGEPAPNGAWGWRYEGHHCSQNRTRLKCGTDQ